MPLFRRVDPPPRALIAYIVARAVDRGITLTRTALVKLLYLVDVARVENLRDPLTDFDWVFFHYGPYAFELIDVLEDMEQGELVATPWNNAVLYRSALGAPDGSEWPAGTKNLVDHVVDEFGPLELNRLLDHVYFHTGPMISAHRGKHLDMSLAREYRQRAHVPLRAAAPPADVSDRLARWRERTTTALPKTRLDPPGRFLDTPDDSDSSLTDAGQRAYAGAHPRRSRCRDRSRSCSLWSRC